MLDHPIEAVWTCVAAFDGIERWAAGVEACRVEGQGVGAIRTVKLGDRVAREQLEAIDAADRRLRYRILPPHALPAEDVCSEICLTALDDGRTEMVWRSQATGFTVPANQLGARIERFYDLSIDGLARLLRKS
jgi:uncharacterized protein YndB with AHSA1/START domain